jgi:hypothetical protein
VGACFARVRAGERVADVAGPTLKASSHTDTFKTACWERVRGCFPIIFFLRACISLPMLFHIRSAATSCAFSPLETPPPR